MDTIALAQSGFSGHIGKRALGPSEGSVSVLASLADGSSLNSFSFGAQKSLQFTLRHPCAWLDSTADLSLLGLEIIDPSQCLFEFAAPDIEKP